MNSILDRPGPGGGTLVLHWGALRRRRRCRLSLPAEAAQYFLNDDR